MKAASFQWHRWVLVFLLLGLGYIAGSVSPALIDYFHDPETERGTIQFTRLTSPFLESAGEMNGDSRLVHARRHVLSYLNELRRSDPTLRVSVYARDLNNGPWIGIQERDLFVPASMNKVPVLIYILAQAEADPSILGRTVVFPGVEAMTSQDSMEELSEYRMSPGQSYSYDELLFRMISYSDNHAKDLLMAAVSEEDVEALLGVINAGSTKVDRAFWINAKTYAGMFRVLYNSNFLGRAMSEYALDLLTRSYFQGGIRRFVPEDVPIASKFGFVRQNQGVPVAAELHECGIIYQPGSPYVLCVMTESDQASENEMAEVIANVSRIVWQAKTE